MLRAKTQNDFDGCFHTQSVKNGNLIGGQFSIKTDTQANRITFSYRRTGAVARHRQNGAVPENAIIAESKISKKFKNSWDLKN